MRLPTFIVIGAGKGGTTSLYQYLNDHPQVFMSAIKETNYFVFEAQNPVVMQHLQEDDFPVRSFEQYAALFSDAGDATAVGEASPKYMPDPLAIARIRERLPTVKLIAILRHPVDRAYSAYAMRIRESLEPRTFARAIEEEDSGSFSPALEFGQKNYVSDGYYGRQLENVYALFDRSQVAVHLYEDLQRDALRLMSQIYQFIGVDEQFLPDTSVHYNSSRPPENKLLQPFLHKSPLTRAVRQILPEIDAPACGDTATGPAQPRQVVTSKMPEEIRNQLATRYRDDILLLQDLIRRDLSHWLAP